MLRKLILLGALLLPSVAVAGEQRPTTYVVKGPLGNVRQVWTAPGPGGTVVYRWKYGWHRSLVRQYP
jgi:hypothetical protein